ncbi:MAG: ubiquinol-cytochrome c reductase cytochrome b subunit [Thermoleophilia bacterium]|nr:ubiquinol-cytochrome c reductase cytochrome b subunit [Thermoleophilia bacterium]
MIRGLVRFVDQRSGGAPFVRKALRYVFPDHWSFLLGEVALYCFMLLVATGVYLTLFFDDSRSATTYHGPYEPLDGATVSRAYASVLHLSFQVKAGLLMRQTHHWAANLFIAAIVLHMLRVFFTGAFRKPRDLIYLLGLGMLFSAFLEGYLGYSLVDDLLSGMGLAIGYSVAMSIPVVGAYLAMLIWGGPFPGSADFWPRMYIAHVLILPLVIATLLALHLTLVAARHHTQFRESPRTTERQVVGVPTFPGQAPRSIGLMLAVFAVLFLLGGLVQINPVWLWGPYHVGDATNGAQPDWYLGWLIGGLRLMPGFDVTIGHYTLIPNPFWGGVAFPLAVLLVLALWPWAERKVAGDDAFHNLLERPRDNPWRTALGAAFVTWVFLIFVSGSGDRIDVWLGIDYVAQVWVYRIAALVLPVAVFFVTRRVCRELVAWEVLRRDMPGS